MTSPLRLYKDIKQNPHLHFLMIEFSVQIQPNKPCEAEPMFHERWAGNSPHPQAGNVLKRSRETSESSDKPRSP